MCLAQKKRGFGAGYWNGYGGKIEMDETPKQSAVREVREESSVTVNKQNLSHVANLKFYFVDGAEVNVAAYIATKWEGEPWETEEMTPRWFSISDLPYEAMWESDCEWLPKILSGKKVVGEIYFEADGTTVASCDVKVVETL